MSELDGRVCAVIVPAQLRLSSKRSAHTPTASALEPSTFEERSNYDLGIVLFITVRGLASEINAMPGRRGHAAFELAHTMVMHGRHAFDVPAT
jgi:hypothetical protein